MAKFQSIDNMSKFDVKQLIDSVDTVLFDVDGVLLQPNRDPMPGTSPVISKLRNLGKNISFVTSNPLMPTDYFNRILAPFNAISDEIYTSNTGIVHYLKTNNSTTKDIFVIGSEVLKQQIRDLGLKVIDFKDIQTTPVGEENIEAIRELYRKALEICKNVEIVVLCLDLNLRTMALNIALAILEHVPDSKLIAGLVEDRGDLGGGLTLICTANYMKSGLENYIVSGAKYYIEAIERFSGKKAMSFGKPHPYLGELIKKRFDIIDSNRVLMIGDTVINDIGFGVHCGFKTMLLLSGATKEHQLKNWEFNPDFKPDFVASGLAALNEKI